MLCPPSLLWLYKLSQFSRPGSRHSLLQEVSPANPQANSSTSYSPFGLLLDSELSESLVPQTWGCLHLLQGSTCSLRSQMGEESKRGKSLHWQGAGDRTSSSPEHPQTSWSQKCGVEKCQTQLWSIPQLFQVLGGEHPFLDCTPSNSPGPLGRSRGEGNKQNKGTALCLSSPSHPPTG